MTRPRPNAAKIDLETCLELIRDALDCDPLLPEFVAGREVRVQVQSATPTDPMSYLVTRGAITDVTSMAIGAAVQATESLDYKVVRLKNGTDALKGRVSVVAVGQIASATLRAARYATPQAHERRLGAQRRVAAFCEARGRNGLKRAIEQQGIERVS